MVHSNGLARGDDGSASIPTLEALREADNVEFVQESRPFEQEKFEGLRNRYESISGVVQVGVIDPQGRVLLVGPDQWVPPGAEVGRTEDWAAAARTGIMELTGVDVVIDAAERVEETKFYLESDEDQWFIAPSVFITARLAVDAEQFRQSPTPADDLDHKIYGDGSDIELRWFDSVPEDAHPNHLGDIELFLRDE